MRWRWWKTAEEKSACFTKAHPARSDREFLKDCGIAVDSEAARVALAVRRSVASYGMTQADHISRDHSYPGQLGALSGWDSLDFLGWVLELESELGVEVSDRWFTDLHAPFTVQELVDCVLAGLDTEE